MQFRVDQEQLSAALSMVTRALPVRTTMPILEGIYVRADQEGVMMICSDLSKGVETRLEAEVTEKGEAVLPGKLTAEIVRKLAPGEVSFATEGNTVVLSTLSSTARLQAQDAEQYPPLPEVEGARPVIIAQSALKDLIRQCSFAVATEELRPALTGAFLEITGSQCRMVALDGFRLALRQVQLGEDYGKLSAVIPGVALQDMTKILSADPEAKANLTLTGSHILVELGQTRFVSRLLDSEYIKYQQILPAEWQTRIQVATADMNAALERVSTMARDGRNNLVRLYLRTGELELKADSELGQASERVPVRLEGPELDISFNSRYLMDVMRNCDADEVYFCFNSNVSPCVVRPLQGEDFLYLILPVRVYA